MNDTLPTLSMIQPWASLLVHGLKRIETRSWKLPGPFPRVLAIHASKTLSLATKASDLSEATPEYEHYAAALKEMGCPERTLRHRGIDGVTDRTAISMKGLPLGAVIGLVRVRECLPTEKLFVQLRLSMMPAVLTELAFGDYTEGRWGWICDRFHVFAEPTPARGSLGIWQWQSPADVLAIAEEMGR